MKFNKFLALTAAAGLAFSVNAYAAKEIKIASNNTPYSEADVQKLAATATGMGVKEPECRRRYRYRIGQQRYQVYLQGGCGRYAADSGRKLQIVSPSAKLEAV